MMGSADHSTVAVAACFERPPPPPSPSHRHARTCTQIEMKGWDAETFMDKGDLYWVVGAIEPPPFQIAHSLYAGIILASDPVHTIPFSTNPLLYRPSRSRECSELRASCGRASGRARYGSSGFLRRPQVDESCAGCTHACGALPRHRCSCMLIVFHAHRSRRLLGSLKAKRILQDCSSRRRMAHTTRPRNPQAKIPWTHYGLTQLAAT